MFLNTFLCNCKRIYEFGTDYTVLIFLLLWIVSCVAVFYSSDASSWLLHDAGWLND
jgi:hypothetical protein